MSSIGRSRVRLSKLGQPPVIAIFALLATVQAQLSRAAEAGFERLFNLDIEQLSNIPVNTVSNVNENLRDAPSTTIVLTRAQLAARGYRNLTQIFDDLPGMDVVRPYGDVYFANYWRGIHNNLGSPYLLLLDGVVQNDLYYNNADIMAALSLSAVDRIEIVYGPASVVYGANALAGVVNIITRHEAIDEGFHSAGEVKTGSFGSRIGDVFASVGHKAWDASVSARYDYGQVDDRYTNDYEWTQDHYYADPQLWGGFSAYGNYGQFNSAHRNSAVDFRLGWRDTVLTLQQFTLNSGFGSEYPADIAQNFAWWGKSADSISLSNKQAFSDKLFGKTLLRYRTNALHKPSDFLEAYNQPAIASQPTDSGIERVLRYSLWDISNDSTSVTQDLEWNASQQWKFNGGIKVEKKDLQKAARISYGPTVVAETANPASYDFPSQPLSDPVTGNRTTTTDKGIYGLATWRIPKNFADADTHILNAGIRVDDNSFYGSETSFRGGYVSHYGDFTAKLMAIGESYQEPTPRALYSGWAGSGSDPDLDPETASTTEISFEYTQPEYSALISLYEMHMKNAIVNFSGGAANAGESRFNGVDMHLNRLVTLASGEWLRLWAYYSWLDTDVLNTMEGVNSPLGDTSPHKLHLGLMLPLEERWQASIRSRYYSARKTVSSNPVGEVKGYATADINLRYQVSAKEGLNVALSVENMFDKRYFHPGVRQADAGVLPGEFDQDGVWQGSDGYFNSLLPQEGRGIFLSLMWDQ